MNNCLAFTAHAIILLAREERREAQLVLRLRGRKGMSRIKNHQLPRIGGQ
jgi:hypothetical protein